MTMEVLAQMLVDSTPQLMQWFMTGDQSRETQALVPLARLLEERRILSKFSRE
jgi:hypothetical protein